MRFKLDLTGKIFNRWTVIELDLQRSLFRKEAYYKCRCECGTIKSVYGYSLRTNENTSCGCRKGELATINRQRNNPAIFSIIEEFFRATKTINNPDSVELAWAAGFFDGEGCTVYSDRLVVSLCQVELEPLERFNRILDIGSILGPYKPKGNRSPYYMWHANSTNAVKAIQKLWPYLSQPKRNQALEKITNYKQYIKSTLKGELE